MNTTEEPRTRPEVFDDERFLKLLLEISGSHGEGSPTLDQMKRSLTEARDEAQHYMGTFREVEAAEILLSKLREGYTYVGIAGLALTFWWSFTSRDAAYSAARKALGLPATCPS